MYQCFNCGNDSVSWDADFDFEDFGLEEDGIVHVCHCNNCGAYITYEVPISDDAIESTKQKLIPTRNTGKWYEVDGCMTICSECHSLGCGTKFCPNCGAEMVNVADFVGDCERERRGMDAEAESKNP